MTSDTDGFMEAGIQRAILRLVRQTTGLRLEENCLSVRRSAYASNQAMYAVTSLIPGLHNAAIADALFHTTDSLPSDAGVWVLSEFEVWYLLNRWGYAA